MGRKKQWNIRTGGSNDWEFNKLLKKFKKQSQERGQPDLYYTTPSEERREAFDKAVKREQKRVERDTPKPRWHHKHH